MKRRRADALLVERGLAPDVARARALILAGEVVVGERRVDKAGGVGERRVDTAGGIGERRVDKAGGVGERRVDKAGELLPVEASLRLKGREHPYVSRGGVKLAHALDHFGIDPTGRVALDLGASTGGFTDVLLRRGARRVYAVDVGYGQLAWSLRGDARVVVLERTHAQDLGADRVPEPIDLLVSDVSFTSLARVLPPVLPLLAPGASAVLLVKPQFEAPSADVGAGGVVTDPAVRDRVGAEVRADVEALGFRCRGLVESPLPGAQGNVELLLAAEWLGVPSPG